MVKVAFIGAGSVEFTRNVVTDLCSFGELHGDLELSLHDIDAGRLGYADALAKRISGQSGAGANVVSSIDRLSAIEGADYVVNEIQVGGYRATRTDFDIPAPVSYTHLRAHETVLDLVCRLLLEKKKK